MSEEIYDEIAMQRFGCKFRFLSAWNQEIIVRSFSKLTEEKLGIPFLEQMQKQESDSEELENEITDLEDRVAFLERELSDLQHKLSRFMKYGDE